MINEFMEEAPIIAALICFLLALLILAYMIYKREPFSMKKHGPSSWLAFVNIRALFILLIVCGIFLIINR